MLGLLGVRPWTAYELVGQAKRSLHFVWPRSEALLYAELKKFVERGHAAAELIDGRGRQRTLYTITALGRAALSEWLATEPAPPTVEFEALLRLFLGDQSTADDLRTALERTRQQARMTHRDGRAVIEDQLATGGPFPERLHLAVPLSDFYDRFLRLIIDWCDETIAEIETWPDTRDVGLTAEGRERLKRMAALPSP